MGYKPIQIDIYDTRIKDKLLTYDFSINTAIITLSSIADFFDIQSEDESEQNIAIWFWEYIIENGIDVCDAIADITQNRVLRVPQKNEDAHIIHLHGEMYHFWRTVELMIRLPNFYISDDLMAAHKEHYGSWLNKEYFADNGNRIAFINKFVHIVVNYCYGIKDLRAMMNVLDMFDFNELFSDLLIDFPTFNVQLQNAIKQKDYEELTLVIFISYGYPFKLSDDNRKMKELENENEELRQENETLAKAVYDLEQSKVKLAVNCSKAIDQLRSVFSQK